jgi:predicted transcriptional regulator
MDEDQSEVSLSDLQLTVMRVLWAQPDSSTAQVVEALRATRPLAHTTVATLLTRLEKRGLVSATREGRQLLYRPEVTERQVKRSMVSNLVSSLFEGNASALLSHLLRADEIGTSDLEKIRAMLDSKESGDE